MTVSEGFLRFRHNHCWVALLVRLSLLAFETWRSEAIVCGIVVIRIDESDSEGDVDSIDNHGKAHN